MQIWILSRPRGSKVIPRPYNAAINTSELVELLGRMPGDDVLTKNINTDQPVLVTEGTEFFAFSGPF